MKNLILVAFFLVTWQVLEARETINDSTPTFVFTSTHSFTLEMNKPAPGSILFCSSTAQIFMKIDKDGDIFLRGKWIGKDKRLVHIFDYWR